MTKTMELPRTKPRELNANFNSNETRKLYNTLVMLAFFMDVISPGHHWKIRLNELIDTHVIDTSAMGFPDDWRERPIWR